MYLDEAVTAIMRFGDHFSWMYLDSVGNVCIGPHLILSVEESATELPFQLHTAAPASMKEIRQEYAKVKCMRAGLVPLSYRRFDSLLLHKDAIAQLLRASLVICAKFLTASFPEFPEFPDPAKVALLDICFDVGLSKLPAEFCDAIQQQKWAVAAALSRRADESVERNDWTLRQFIDLPEIT